MGTAHPHRPARRATRTLGVAVVALLAVLLGACGGDEGASSDTTVVVAAGAADLEAALSASVDQPSVRARVRMSVDGQPAMDASMVQSADGRSGEGTMTLPSVGDVPFRLVDGTWYYGFPDLPDGRSWVRMTEDELQQLTGLDAGAANSQDPFAALSVLKGVSDSVEVVGTDDVDGEQLTRFRMAVRVPDLFRHQADAGVFDPAMAEEASRVFAARTDIDVWVDGDRLVRRMEYSMEVVEAGMGLPEEAVGAEFDYRFDFEGYGEPVTVEAPPADDVIDAGQLLGRSQD